VDCLDRTNTFQQLLGEAALSLQIAKMYETSTNQDSHHHESFLDDTTLKHFREMFGRMGDIVSLQYGGSIAHKTNFGNKNTTKQIEFFTSLKRYYSNTFTDQYKQCAINLFLGLHKPHVKQPPLWETTAPIIWMPNTDTLTKFIGDADSWWKKPLETFYSSITINSDIQELKMRLSQPPVVKVDSNNSIIECLQEDFSMNITRSRKPSMIGDFEAISMKSSSRFDSMPISERIWLPFAEKNFDVGLDLSRNINYAYSESEQSASMREPLTHTNKNKQTMFSDEENGTDADKKLLIIEDKKLLVENYQFSEPNFSVSGGTKVKNTSIVTEYRKLTDVSKKVRKTYNNVLYVDEKFDEIEENMRKQKSSMNKTGQRSGASQKVVRQIAFPEDQRFSMNIAHFSRKILMKCSTMKK